MQLYIVHIYNIRDKKGELQYGGCWGLYKEEGFIMYQNGGMSMQNESNCHLITIFIDIL